MDTLMLSQAYQSGIFGRQNSSELNEADLLCWAVSVISLVVSAMIVRFGRLLPTSHSQRWETFLILALGGSGIMVGLAVFALWASSMMQS